MILQKGTQDKGTGSLFMIKKDNSEKIEQLQRAIDMADCIIIGAGAGLSTAAGFTYTGERFETYFSDFAKK